MRACLAIVGASVLLLGLAIGAWLNRDEIIRGFERATESTPAEPAPTPDVRPEIARATEAKIIELGRGRASEVELTPSELRSWIRYGLAGFFPEYVSQVSATVDEHDRLVLDGRVVVREVPGAADLGPAAFLVGDTAPLVVVGRPDGLGPGRGVLYVEDIRVGPVPLPEGVRRELLGRLGAGTDDRLPANAVAFELPPFVEDVGVRNGRLVLRRGGAESR